MHADWHAVIRFLDLIDAAIWAGTWRFLPASLHGGQFQRFDARHLMAGYRQVARSARFMTLVLARGIPFNGMFLYGLAAPVFLGEHLKLGPTQFFGFFVLTIAGTMGDACASGALGRTHPAAPPGAPRLCWWCRCSTWASTRCCTRTRPGPGCRWRCSPSAGR